MRRPDEGKSSYLVQPADDAAPTLSPGDRIRVSPNRQAFGDVPLEAVDVDPLQAPYGFVDFERGMPLLWLALGFVVLVAALGRRVGVLSLVGVGVGLVLVTKFVVPGRRVLLSDTEVGQAGDHGVARETQDQREIAHACSVRSAVDGPAACA